MIQMVDDTDGRRYRWSMIQMVDDTDGRICSVYGFSVDDLFLFSFKPLLT